MIASEVRIGLTSKDALQQCLLDGCGVVCGGLELGKTAADRNGD